MPQRFLDLRVYGEPKPWERRELGLHDERPVAVPTHMPAPPPPDDAEAIELARAELGAAEVELSKAAALDRRLNGDPLTAGLSQAAIAAIHRHDDARHRRDSAAAELVRIERDYRQQCRRSLIVLLDSFADPENADLLARLLRLLRRAAGKAVRT
jgi:hypothetical protein